MSSTLLINGNNAGSVYVPYGQTASLSLADSSLATSLLWEILPPKRLRDGAAIDAATNWPGWTVNSDGSLSKLQTGGGPFAAVTGKPDVYHSYTIRCTETRGVTTLAPVSAIMRVRDPKTGTALPAAGENIEADPIRGWWGERGLHDEALARRGQIRVYNGTGSTIAALKVCKIGSAVDFRTVGGNANPGGSATQSEKVFSIAKADPAEANASRLRYCVLDESLANGAFGWAVISGDLAGDFSGLATSRKIFCDANADLKVNPEGKTIIEIGACVDASATGRLAVSIVVHEDSEPALPEWFDAKGDGVSYDRAALQSTINLGRPVRLQRGATYVVESSGLTKEFESLATTYALALPDNAVLDMNGATIKLADGQDCTVLINASAGTSTATGIKIFGGTIDQNQVNQSAPADGYAAALLLYDFEDCEVTDLVVIDAYEYSGRFLKGTSSTFRNLTGLGAKSEAWAFGIAAGDQYVTDSTIDNIWAEDCEGDYLDRQGAGFVASVKRCTSTYIGQKNTAGGLKIQHDSQDCHFERLEFFGGALSSANSGVKFQGQSGIGLIVQRISVGSILAKDAHSEGLYVFDTDGLKIGKYEGLGNAIVGSRSITIEGTDVQIANLSDRDSVHYGLVFNGNANNYHIGSAYIKNAVGYAMQVAASNSYGTIDTLIVEDDRGTPLITSAAIVTAGTAVVHVGKVHSNLTWANTRGLLYSDSAKAHFGPITTGAGAAVSGIVTLTAGTTTAVANANVAKVYAGTNVSCHPVIRLTPINAAAAALVARVSNVPDSSASTGFTITHSTAAGTEKFLWQLVGHQFQDDWT